MKKVLILIFTLILAFCSFSCSELPELNKEDVETWGNDLAVLYEENEYTPYGKWYNVKFSEKSESKGGRNQDVSENATIEGLIYLDENGEIAQYNVEYSMTMTTNGISMEMEGVAMGKGDKHYVKMTITTPVADPNGGVTITTQEVEENIGYNFCQTLSSYVFAIDPTKLAEEFDGSQMRGVIYGNRIDIRGDMDMQGEKATAIFQYEYDSATAELRSWHLSMRQTEEFDNGGTIGTISSFLDTILTLAEETQITIPTV